MNLPLYSSQKLNLIIWYILLILHHCYFHIYLKNSCSSSLLCLKFTNFDLSHETITLLVISCACYFIKLLVYVDFKFWLQEETAEENGEERHAANVETEPNVSEILLPDENPLLSNLPPVKDLVVEEEEQVGNEEEGEVKTKAVDLTRDDALMKVWLLN